jgi:predicted dehydrogenase
VLDCIHEIDLALWYFGPARVAAAVALPATSLGLETDGLAEILLRHESSVLSSVHLNFVQRDYRRCCQVIGTEGTITWDFTRQQVELYGPDGSVEQVFPQPAGWEINQMYLDELAHFVAAVRDGQPTINPLAGGQAALRIALSVREQSKGGADDHTRHHPGAHDLNPAAGQGARRHRRQTDALARRPPGRRRAAG